MVEIKLCTKTLPIPKQKVRNCIHSSKQTSRPQSVSASFVHGFHYIVGKAKKRLETESPAHQLTLLARLHLFGQYLDMLGDRPLLPLAELGRNIIACWMYSERCTSANSTLPKKCTSLLEGYFRRASFRELLRSPTVSLEM